VDIKWRPPVKAGLRIGTWGPWRQIHPNFRMGRNAGATRKWASHCMCRLPFELDAERPKVRSRAVITLQKLGNVLSPPISLECQQSGSVTGAGDRLGSLGSRTADLPVQNLGRPSSFLHLVQSCPLATRGPHHCSQLPGRCVRLGGLHSREAQVPGAVVTGSEPDNIAGGIAQEADRR
jgi:hypothetical protein